MTPESLKLLRQYSTALSNETIYGESGTASMKRWREYGEKTKAAREALEAHIERLEGSSASQQAAAVAAPSEQQIIAALHANGIDTYPSKYGFDAAQVSATSVPSLRNVFATLYATAAAATTIEDARDAALEQAAKVAENYGPSRPIVTAHPGERIKGRWEGEQAASSIIAGIIRGMKSNAAMRATQQEGGNEH